jgi:hypothetical protein
LLTGRRSDARPHTNPRVCRVKSSRCWPRSCCCVSPQCINGAQGFVAPSRESGRYMVSAAMHSPSQLQTSKRRPTLVTPPRTRSLLRRRRVISSQLLTGVHVLERDYVGRDRKALRLGTRLSAGRRVRGHIPETLRQQRLRPSCLHALCPGAHLVVSSSAAERDRSAQSSSHAARKARTAGRAYLVKVRLVPRIAAFRGLHAPLNPVPDEAHVGLRTARARSRRTRSWASGRPPPASCATGRRLEAAAQRRH